MIPIRPADEILDQPFWQFLAKGQLWLNHCESCGAFRHPPGPVCPRCRTIGNAWAPVSGRGVLKSFTVIRHPVHQLLRDSVPYTVTLVDLEEGVRLVSGIPAGMDVSLKVGMALQCHVVSFDERYALPYFLPVGMTPA